MNARTSRPRRSRKSATPTAPMPTTMPASPNRIAARPAKACQDHAPGEPEDAGAGDQQLGPPRAQEPLEGPQPAGGGEDREQGQVGQVVAGRLADGDHEQDQRNAADRGDQAVPDAFGADQAPIDDQGDDRQGDAGQAEEADDPQGVEPGRRIQAELVEAQERGARQPGGLGIGVGLQARPRPTSGPSR